MSQAVVFKAETRKSTGTGSARELRRQEKVPAVIYGVGSEPLHIALPMKEVTLRSAKRNFKSTIFEIELDGKKINTIAKDIQFNVVTDKPEHIDLQIVSEKTAVKVFVPVTYTNQVKSPGLKKGGVLNIVQREIELFVPPAKIPDEIVVDLAGLEIGHTVHIKDIKLAEGLRPVLKRNFTIATIVGKGAEEEAAATPGAAGADATAAGAAAAPAAGAAAPAAAAKPAAGAAAAKPAAGAAAKPAAKK